MSQTVFDVGDPVTSRLTLGVTPDGTTVVTVVITKPDGTALVPGPVVTGPVGQDYTTTFTASVAGDWVAVWTVTGTGAGVQAKVYNVLALPGSAGALPVWAPFLSDVGDHVPLKTQSTIAGADIRYGTFNGNTEPDDGQAQRILAKSVAWVLSAVPVILPDLETLARSAAALRAAADIELAWPERAADLSQYTAMDARAKAELERLVLADQSSPVGSTAGVPQWDMPNPPRWADDFQMWL